MKINNSISAKISLIDKLNGLFKDARHFQILWLSIFLMSGILFLDWQARWFHYLCFFGVAISAQLLFSYFTTKNYSSWKSAMITALGLCLLCNTNLFLTAIFAALLAIAGKFLIRYKNKHLFNPVNIGLVITVLFTGDAWVSPGQWGSHFIILFALGGMGFLVLKKVNRIDSCLSFLAFYGALQFARSVLYLGWPIDHFIHQMTSGTIMLFAFFMITDPMTTPNHRTARIIWSLFLSIIAFGLSSFAQVYAAPIFALFIMTPTSIIFDRYFIQEKFQWNAKPVSNEVSLTNQTSIL